MAGSLLHLSSCLRFRISFLPLMYADARGHRHERRLEHSHRSAHLCIYDSNWKQVTKITQNSSSNFWLVVQLRNL